MESKNQLRSFILALVSIFSTHCGVTDPQYESYATVVALSPASTTTACGTEALALFTTAFPQATANTCLGCHGPTGSNRGDMAIGADADTNRSAFFAKTLYDSAALIAKIKDPLQHSGSTFASSIDSTAFAAWSSKETECSQTP